jgi:hypothetical protein
VKYDEKNDINEKSEEDDKRQNTKERKERERQSIGRAVEDKTNISVPVWLHMCISHDT